MTPGRIELDPNRVSPPGSVPPPRSRRNPGSKSSTPRKIGAKIIHHQIDDVGKERG